MSSIFQYLIIPSLFGLVVGLLLRLLRKVGFRPRLGWLGVIGLAFLNYILITAAISIRQNPSGFFLFWKDILVFSSISLPFLILTNLLIVWLIVLILSALFPKQDKQELQARLRSAASLGITVTAFLSGLLLNTTSGTGYDVLFLPILIQVVATFGAIGSASIQYESY